jgi:peroxiredoxin
MKKATLVFGMLMLSMFYYHNLAIGQSEMVGTTAAAFALPNVDGKTVSLDDYNNEKGVILIFTCNHCPYAKMYESRIIELNAMYAEKGYPVVAISPNDPAIEPDDSPENMTKHAKKMKYAFPYLFDATQMTAKAYNAKVTPHVYIMEKTDNGFVVRYIGAIDDNPKDASAVNVKYAENALNALLQAESVETTSTKALGCGIKWKAN